MMTKAVISIAKQMYWEHLSLKENTGSLYCFVISWLIYKFLLSYEKYFFDKACGDNES